MESTKHISVMQNEAIEFLNLKKGMTVVDATLGGGGYTREIYNNIMPGGTLIACDRDIDAINRFKKDFGEIVNNIHIVHSNYSHIRKILKDINIDFVDAIVADLGLSSDQIEKTDRGFSFSDVGLLDMRMDQGADISAYDIVNNYSEEELSQIIFMYGDEKFARRIAHAICEKRPIQDTNVLTEVVVSAIPHSVQQKSKIHPATRTFQAIRIAVNDEFKHLKIFLTEGIKILQKSGRFSVVSFHSGEDRIVKNIFRTNARGCICAPEMPVCRCEHEPQVRVLTKKPLTSSEKEVRDNPRSRSARLRVVEKI
ncbi:MAG: 16S rRNA (cytosine(1402)-N(4))-methyltransferase RsmH [Patescibacteria group bacterium]|nr:16S rRNA (cytosine(1402)-N(4))-methyltransferase RsmH [Patescibacteria group bacterium]